MADLISDETYDKTFRDIPGLSKWMVTQLESLNIKHPTPIQLHCIQAALKGNDVIGSAKTGSGKTMAFLVPILQTLSVDPYGVFAVIVTPTRELASQITDQFRSVGVAISLRVCLVTGGMKPLDQGRELSQAPHIIVATPGRLAEILVTSPPFTLKRTQFIVLDEADMLLAGPFDDDLKTIFDALPPKRQTLLFSATLTERLKNMKDVAKSQVFMWQSDSPQATVEQLEEKYILVNPIVKAAALVTLVKKFRKYHKKELCLVFVKSCKTAEILRLSLNELGLSCVSLHSQMPQDVRTASLTAFKSNIKRILIATDVANRGLDIPKVSLVINYDIPPFPNNYIHRVGRTARIGRKGIAMTLLTQEEIPILLKIEGKTNNKMMEHEYDTEMMERILKEVNITLREQELKLEEEGFDELRNIHKRKRMLLAGKDPDRPKNNKGKSHKKSTKRLVQSQKGKYNNQNRKAKHKNK